MSTPIVIMASGRGSGFEAIMKSVKAGALRADVLALLSDQPNAPVLDKARAMGIRTILVSAAQGRANDRRMHDERVLTEIKALSPEFQKKGFLVMAGYMRIITPVLIDAFRSDRGYSRIVNIHPSLLPAFPGRDAYGQAFRYGAKISGVTVHLVEQDVDSGPICAQEAFSISDCQSVSEVEQRGLAIEHRLYPEALKWVLPEEFSVKAEGRVCVRQN